MNYLITLVMTTQQMYVLFAILLVVTLIGSSIFYFWWNRVDESSQMIKDIIMLNSSYKFHKNIKKQERYTKPCNSKAQFDKVNLSTFFMSILEDKIQDYDDLVNRIQANRFLYKEYDKEYRAISSKATKEQAKRYFIPLFMYRFLEKQIANRKKVKPCLDTEFIIRATYISPKGKNSYQKAFTYSLKEAMDTIELVHMQIEKKKTKEYQRALMSDSLRYEIMSRDGFRCQLCGISAKDGAILHVDHILPIAKGGKTVKPNLRTLCDRCNLGKRDKLEK